MSRLYFLSVTVNWFCDKIYIQGDSHRKSESYFTCNYWANEGKQTKLASEALPMHADTMHELFAATSTSFIPHTRYSVIDLNDVGVLYKSPCINIYMCMGYYIII
jgi:hypothetical protein